MTTGYLATAEVTINAPAARVWDALTNPDLIQQYLFGTLVDTDWQVGSPITYSGVWQDKPYEDKGTILEFEPGRRLVSTFWSALSGLPDEPENYNTVQYELSPAGNGATRLTITQDNNATPADAEHSSQNWSTVLTGLKALLES